ncbi:Uncharacterised protein g7563 [Pycnogonum litorale]
MIFCTKIIISIRLLLREFALDYFCLTTYTAQCKQTPAIDEDSSSIRNHLRIKRRIFKIYRTLSKSLPSRDSNRDLLFIAEE